MRVVIDTNVWMFVSLITIDGQSLQSPPSLRFPPLREGNRRVWFPLLAGGTLRRGLSTTVFCELWLGDWY
jgi:hypothetical protein